MGTNYYLEVRTEEKAPCSCCGQLTPVVKERIHIGKSSAGWCFSLHIMPNEGIADLADWVAKWYASQLSVIKDEYGAVIVKDDMLRIVTQRGCGSSETSDAQWLTRNSAERGPNGLARHKLSQYCVGHGGGPWDLSVGEFS